MQTIGATRDGKSAVATPDGKKPKEEEAIRDVSPPFDEEHRGLEQDISFPAIKQTFIYFGEVLRCPYKRIFTITKVYIARDSIHVELMNDGFY